MAVPVETVDNSFLWRGCIFAFCDFSCRYSKNTLQWKYPLVDSAGKKVRTMDTVSPLQFVRYIEGRFPGCFSVVDGLRQAEQWPSVQDVTGALAEKYGLSGDAAAFYAPAVCACAVWICYKRIYAYREPLVQMLCENDSLKALQDFPIDSIRFLPFPGIYISTPAGFCSGIHGFFVWLSQQEDLTVLELLFLHENGYGFTPGRLKLHDGVLFSAALPEASSILEVLLSPAVRGDESALQVILQKLPLTGPYPNVIHNLISRAAQLLLYLISANADTVEEPETTGIVTVGKHLSRKLQDPRSPKSHIRQGHWHKYWYGPKNGKRYLIPKWIPPMIVGEGRELSAPLTVQNID